MASPSNSQLTSAMVAQDEAGGYSAVQYGMNDDEYFRYKQNQAEALVETIIDTATKKCVAEYRAGRELPSCFEDGMKRFPDLNDALEQLTSILRLIDKYQSLPQSPEKVQKAEEIYSAIESNLQLGNGYPAEASRRAIQSHPQLGMRIQPRRAAEQFRATLNWGMRIQPRRRPGHNQLSDSGRRQGLDVDSANGLFAGVGLSWNSTSSVHSGQSVHLSPFPLLKALVFE